VEASSAAGSAVAGSVPEAAENETEPARNDLELNEDQVAALASGFVEAKHEETQEEAEADAIVGGAEFDEEEKQKKQKKHRPLKSRNSPRKKLRKSKLDAPPTGRNSLRTWLKSMPNTTQRMASTNMSSTNTPRSGMSTRKRSLQPPANSLWKHGGRRRRRDSPPRRNSCPARWRAERSS